MGLWVHREDLLKNLNVRAHLSLLRAGTWTGEREKETGRPWHCLFTRSNQGNCRCYSDSSVIEGSSSRSRASERVSNPEPKTTFTHTKFP